MTITERIVKEYLLKNGYKEEDIFFNRYGSPDFILSDCRKIEVKRLYNNSIYFTKKQIELDDNVEVFLVNEKLDNPIVDIIPFYEIKKVLDSMEKFEMNTGFINWKGKKYRIIKESGELIEIRCTKTTKKNFKIMLSEVKNSEDLIKILWIIYKTQPGVFTSAMNLVQRESI
jgi:hypothetical protein